MENFGNLIIIAVMTITVSYSQTTMRPSIRPEIVRKEDYPVSSVDIVKGATQCGGAGKLVQVRVQGCHRAARCKINEGENYGLFEVEFVASKNIDGLNYNADIITRREGTIFGYTGILPGSSVDEGRTHVFRYKVVNLYREGDYKVEFYLTDRFNKNHTEICALYSVETVKTVTTTIMPTVRMVGQ